MIARRQGAEGVHIAATAGPSAELARRIAVALPDVASGQGMTEEALREGRLAVLRDIRSPHI